MRLIDNTRSSLALTRANIPESEWNLIDMTHDITTQNKISNRLAANGLTDEGTEVLRIGDRVPATAEEEFYSILD